MRILVVGASGFIGSHVMTSGRSSGLDVHALHSIRLVAPVPLADGWLDAWRQSNRPILDRLCRALDGADVVINAAGVAEPRRALDGVLLGANAGQPVIVSEAARKAGVRRLVHVSTAAVQGRTNPLNEAPSHHPLSPYAASKAQGEAFLLDPARDAPPELLIYRPASVLALGRPVTKTLARVATLPATFLSGDGDEALPVALIENVAAGIVFAATSVELVSEESRVVVLQPWEGITARLLLELFAVRRLVSLPPPATEAALGVMAGAGSWSPRLTARVRWLELLWRGQSVRAQRLADAGFFVPVGHEGWKELGTKARAGSGER